MAKSNKFEPIENPEAFGTLYQSLKRGLADVEARGKLAISLHISGGLPSQSYHFDFRIAGNEVTNCELDCTLTGRKGNLESIVIEQDDYALLLRALLERQVLEIPQETPRFLPDTVVGYLEVMDGESSQRIYFAADENQASVQDKLPSPELLATIEPIYLIAGKLLDMESVKP